MKLYTELIEGFVGHSYDFVPVADLKLIAREKQSFSSMFLLDENVIAFRNECKERGEILVKGKQASIEFFAKYEGKYYLKNVWFDFDDLKGAVDLDVVRLDTKRFINSLIMNWGVHQNNIIVYFSGAKGFHVGFPAAYLGTVEPSNKLPDQVKTLAQNIIAKVVGLAEKEIGGKIQKTADDSIYNAGRIWRLPFSKHAKTGLYKTPFTVEEFQKMQLPEILEIAKVPRLDFQSTIEAQVPVSEELQKLWQGIVTKPEITAEEREIVASVPESNDAKFDLAARWFRSKYPDAITYQSGRNNAVTYFAGCCNDLGVGDSEGHLASELIRKYVVDVFNDDVKTWDRSSRGEDEMDGSVLALYRRKKEKFGLKQDYVNHKKNPVTVKNEALFDLTDMMSRIIQKSQLSPKEYMKIAQAFNASAKVSLDSEDVAGLMLKLLEKKGKKERTNWGYTTSELADRWVDLQVKRKGKTLKFGIPPIDDAFDGDVQGRLCMIIGMDGSKKSLLMLQAMSKMAVNGNRGLYSTMEDPGLGQFERLLYSTCDPIQQTDALGNVERVVRQREQWRNLTLKDSELAKSELKKHFGSHYSDNLLFDEQVRMSSEDYDELIYENIKRRGGLEVLGVDGLSMMDSSGNAVSDVERNTAGLKALCNKYGLFGMLLVHVPKSANREDRYLWDNALWGAKSVQNSDYQIALSFCRTPDSKANKIEYDQNLVYCAVRPKRGDGRVRKCILELNDNLDLIYRPELDPADYDKPLKSSRKKSSE